MSPLVWYIFVQVAMRAQVSRKIYKLTILFIISKLIVPNLITAANIYRDGRSAVNVVNIAIEKSKNEGVKFYTFTEPFANWEMHPYTKPIGKTDNINAVQNWQYGGCIHATLYSNFSLSSQFHGKNNLAEMFASLRSANNPRITMIVNIFVQNDEAPDFLKDLNPEATFMTNDQFPMSISVYDIQGSPSLQETEELVRISPEKAHYNLHIIESRV